MLELNLYEPDLRHPSVAGSYLAACVTYATLFKASPVDLKYTADPDPAIANTTDGGLRERCSSIFSRPELDRYIYLHDLPLHAGTALPILCVKNPVFRLVCWHI